MDFSTLPAPVAQQIEDALNQQRMALVNLVENVMQEPTADDKIEAVARARRQMQSVMEEADDALRRFQSMIDEGVC